MDEAHFSPPEVAQQREFGGIKRRLGGKNSVESLVESFVGQSRARAGVGELEKKTIRISQPVSLSLA